MSIKALRGATIAFDLDGTLVDTAPDLIRCMNAVLAQEGLPAIPGQDFRGLVGQGARVLIERGAARHGVTFAAAKLEALTDQFIASYRADIAAESRPFPGVAACLEELGTDGALLTVCTNKRTDLSVPLLEAMGLAHHFAAVIGADRAPTRKPHPDHLRAAVTAAGGDVLNCVMIGDTSADVGTAKGLGAPVILATFGYADGPLDSLGADALFDRYEELGSVIRRLLARSGP
jgi:phosphoglycolate phosphatase